MLRPIVLVVCVLALFVAPPGAATSQIGVDLDANATVDVDPETEEETEASAEASAEDVGDASANTTSDDDYLSGAQVNASTDDGTVDQSVDSDVVDVSDLCSRQYTTTGTNGTAAGHNVSTEVGVWQGCPGNMWCQGGMCVRLPAYIPTLVELEIVIDGGRTEIIVPL